MEDEDKSMRNRLDSLECIEPPFDADVVQDRKCIIGVCCMDIKGNSKPMQHILKRLSMYKDFEIVMFGEKTILEKEIEEWPECDCLIAFFSTGFPLDKAIRYRQLHPTTYCLNELSWQKVLLDRRAVYDILKKNHIPMVKHLVMSRDGYEEEPTFFESRNFIEVNGKRMMKPFVEKPVNAEDHNVHIYYHSDQEGGGSVRLFRKIENKSSERYRDVSTVRREGSYIYEEYVATDNLQDIKVYTIGLDYAHSESRKSPVVDGKVLRGSDGKELRTQIELTPEEVDIARKVVKAFKQQICGFDLLRKDGKSYVCDVNGLSFVKGNQKYYDDFARIVRELFLDAMISKGLPFVTTQKGVRVLRGVAAVFRHADRTPKQKVKIHVSNSEMLSFFGENPRKELKFKNDSPKDQERLNKLLQYAQDLLSNKEKLVASIDPNDGPRLVLFCTVLQRGFGGTKVQIKPLKHTVDPETGKETVTSGLIVCKWGGILTHAGIEQSRLLGKNFYDRVFPKESKAEFTSSVEFISNNERRVKRTAEEFAAGMLGLEETPVDIVNDSKSSAKLLGDISAGKNLMTKTKDKIHEVMHLESTEQYRDYPGLEDVDNPLQMMKEVHAHMKELYNEISSSAVLCEGETIPMMQQRWQRLTANFYSPKKKMFDTTKIPDVFDYLTYDILHNQHALASHDLSKLYEKTELLAKFVVPEEYGLDPEDKLNIGSLICEDLIEKLYKDMKDFSVGQGSKTRLYFTSESHLHSLRNVILHGGSADFHELIEPVELSYLSHLVFKIYENLEPGLRGSTGAEKQRFQIEVLFSSGTHNNPFGVINKEHRQAVRPMVSVKDNLTLQEFEEIVQQVEGIVKKERAIEAEEREKNKAQGKQQPQ